MSIHLLFDPHAFVLQLSIVADGDSIDLIVVVISGIQLSSTFSKAISKRKLMNYETILLIVVDYQSESI